MIIFTLIYFLLSVSSPVYSVVVPMKPDVSLEANQNNVRSPYLGPHGDCESNDCVKGVMTNVPNSKDLELIDFHERVIFGDGDEDRKSKGIDGI
jgi:hypothetical protein